MLFIASAGQPLHQQTQDRLNEILMARCARRLGSLMHVRTAPVQVSDYAKVFQSVGKWIRIEPLA